MSMTLINQRKGRKKFDSFLVIALLRWLREEKLDQKREKTRQPTNESNFFDTLKLNQDCFPSGCRSPHTHASTLRLQLCSCATCDLMLLSYSLNKGMFFFHRVPQAGLQVRVILWTVLVLQSVVENTFLAAVLPVGNGKIGSLSHWCSVIQFRYYIHEPETLLRGGRGAESTIWVTIKQQ